MSKLKSKSLACEISNLITAKTNTIFESDDENDETKAKVDAFEDNSDDDVRTSKLRKRNIDLLDKVDKRYAGKKVSRKDIYKSEFKDEISNEESDDNIEDDNDISSSGSIKDEDKYDQMNEDSSEENKSEDEDIDEEDEEDEEVEGNEDDDESYNEEESDNEFHGDLSSMQEDPNSDTKFSSMSKVNIEEEIEKGNCVRNQIKMWENLLDVRIKFQKCLVDSNKLPQYNVFEQFNSDSNFKKESKKVQNNLKCLLDKLLELNNIFTSKISATKNIDHEENDNEKIEDDLDEEICSDSEIEPENNSDNNENETDDEIREQIPRKKRKLNLSEFEKLISKSHKSYIPFRNSEIKKWNDKTRIARVVSNKGSSQPILQQLDFILKDKSKLVKKTQLKRSEYEILGKTALNNEDGRRLDEYDEEIYDDDDFYHELLRDFIHQKTSDITDHTQLGKQWVQLQNMRSKLKRKIDTRATKGRRLRYNVHQKILNYMAPILINDTMSDLAKDELYNSLFGKIKPVNSENNSV